MKTTLTTVFLILASQFCHSQIPSINETNSTDIKSILADVAKIEDLENVLAAYEKKLTKVEGIDAEKLTNIKKELQTAKVDLFKNVPARKRIYESYVKAYDALIDPVKVSIESHLKSLEKEKDLKVMVEIKQKIDAKTLELEKLKKDRDEELEQIDGFDATFPTMNAKSRERFFHDIYNNNTSKTNYLNSFALSADGKSALAQSEVITDNMWAFRVSFGTVVAASSKETEETNEDTPKAELTAEAVAKNEEDAFKRLLNGGGNFYLELILPLFVTNPNNGDQVTSYGYTSAKGAMDVKGFGNDIDTSTANGSAGFNYYLGVSSDSKRFNFFVFANANYTFGTQDFYKNLGIKDQQGFFNGKVIMGITFLNRFKLSAIVANFGSDEKLRSSKASVGIQILPGF